MNKLIAEFIGILWLVLGGYGSAVLAAAYPELGIGFAGLAIGLGLTLMHLISIPVTNTSLNPARRPSQANFAEGWTKTIVALLGSTHNRSCFGRMGIQSHTSRNQRKLIYKPN